MKNNQRPAPKSILLVCLGNICRSPTAEEVFRQHLAMSGLSIKVDSAGTANYHPGSKPDARSIAHAKAHGYSISKIRARQVLDEDFDRFDLIMAMDEANLEELRERRAALRVGGQEAGAAVVLFSKHDPLFEGTAVPDPYHGSDSDFERVIEQSESSVKAWIQRWQRS